MKNNIVAIVGKPNVGKSTLLNAIFNQKKAIVNKKPQTTRKQSFFIYKNDNVKAIIIDTPGFHLPHNKLDKFLNWEVNNSLKSSNSILYLFDMTREFDVEDRNILNNISKYDIQNKVLIINKAETSKQELIDETANKLKEDFNFQTVIQISALHKINIEKIIEYIETTSSEDIDVSYFKEPDDKFMIAEIIREQCLILLRKEIPYAIGVDVTTNNYDEKTKTFFIDADIIVEKSSQKPIVIGKHASMIKLIGTNARMELLNIYDCKIVLKLYVKVEEDWRNSNYLINSLGYK